MEKYCARLADEISIRVNASMKKSLETVFIGGGNPTSIGFESFRKLINNLLFYLDGAIVLEWTCETNPETFSREIAWLLKSVPNPRISIGVQRLNDSELACLGRKGTVDKARKAVESALSVTDNVGIDLILGVPGKPSIASQLDKFLNEFPISHVSTYFLSAEEGTPLFEQIQAGIFPDVANEGPEELYDVAEILSRKGFEHYEISNFAKPGKRCLHNMNYWIGKDYIGIGPSAVSTLYGRRLTNPCSFKDYIAQREPEVEIISAGDSIREFIMLRLRLLNDGIILSEARIKMGGCFDDFMNCVDRQVSAGNLVMNEDRISLSPSGIAMANRIISDLF